MLQNVLKSYLTIQGTHFKICGKDGAKFERLCLSLDITHEKR